MSNHTPGPWFTKKCSQGGSLLKRDCDQNSVQILPSSDAQLMAAAPELLEALEALLETCDTTARGYDERVNAIKAIAKAKGVKNTSGCRAFFIGGSLDGVTKSIRVELAESNYYSVIQFDNPKENYDNRGETLDGMKVFRIMERENDND